MAPKFSQHPERGIPLVIYSQKGVWAFIEPRSATISLKECDRSLNQDRWSTLNSACQSAVAKNPACWPPQVWMLIWAKDGLWGAGLPTDADFGVGDGPWEVGVEWFIRFSSQPYVSQSACGSQASVDLDTTSPAVTPDLSTIPDDLELALTGGRTVDTSSRKDPLESLPDGMRTPRSRSNKSR